MRNFHKQSLGHLFSALFAVLIRSLFAPVFGYSLRSDFGIVSATKKVKFAKILNSF